MKFIKDKNIDLKSYSIVKILLFVLIVFIFGIWTEKYDLFSKPRSIISKIYENLYSKIISQTYDVEKIIIDINYKNFEKIKKIRQKALKNKYLLSEDSKWSSGKLTYNDQQNKIKIRLKGMLGDHWDHPYKWSFYVKIDDDNSSIFNLRRFTLQPPKTLDFLDEWLFMKALERENLISHRTKFVELIVNGNKYGLYTLQERSMKQLIENNKRREGPVINFSNQERLVEHINKKKLGANKISNYFWRSQINPIQFKKSYKGTVQEKYLDKAISLLESFRNKESKVDEVFDIDQMAKVMALRAIFGSTEFDVDDLKFYYNPITNLLEPISKEVHSNATRFILGYNPWVFRSDNLSISWQKPFLDLLYDDKFFYKKYLNELNNYSSNQYISKLVEENNSEFEEVKKILKLNFPTARLYAYDDFKNISNYIQSTLNPIQKPYFNLLKIFNNTLEFKTTNTQILPIEITGIKVKDKVLNLQSPLFIDGMNFETNNFQKISKLDCSPLKCNNLDLENININYRIFGQNKVYSNNIKFWNNDLKVDTFNSNINDVSSLLKKYSFIKNIENNLIIDGHDWKISERIIIPKNYKLIIKNSSIKFSNNGQLISFSPLHIEGNEEKQVVISSEINSSANNGNGILVLNTKDESFLNHVLFKNLSAPNLISGIGLLGSINFYEADVKISNTSFYNNSVGDDYINIIRSNFLIEDSYFENANSDAIDIDFSEGSILNSKFLMSKNDAIDFSGSKVNLEGIYINGSGDKGISVGEGSILNAKNILIENSNIGIASKDESNVYLDNITIENVFIGLAAYIKKVEYGSPKIKGSNIKVSNYKYDYISDLNTQIQINNTVIKNINCKENTEICNF